MSSILFLRQSLLVIKFSSTAFHQFSFELYLNLLIVVGFLVFLPKSSLFFFSYVLKKLYLSFSLSFVLFLNLTSFLTYRVHLTLTLPLHLALPLQQNGPSVKSIIWPEDREPSFGVPIDDRPVYRGCTSTRITIQFRRQQFQLNPSGGLYVDPFEHFESFLSHQSFVVAENLSVI